MKSLKLKLWNSIKTFWKSLDPQKSLKSTLRVWFILFALVPLLFIVGYSAYLFNQRMNEELVKRLTAFEQGIDLELNDVEEKLRIGGVRHANDYYLINLLRQQKKSSLEEVAQSIIENYITDRISFFGVQGKFETSVSPKRITNDPEALLPEELQTLPASILTALSEKRQVVLKTAYPNIGFALDCYTSMRLGGKFVGVIKETVVLDRYYLLSTRERTGLDLCVLDKDYKLLISTLSPDAEKKFQYPNHHLKKITSFALLNESYLMLTKPLIDEEEKPVANLAILVSRSTTQNTLKEIRNIFVLISVSITIIVLLFTKLASQTVLRPIDLLIEATREIEKGKLDRTVAIPSMHEIGTLVNSFNAMSGSLLRMKRELESKVDQLHQTNLELKNTQAQLIHSSKMISLGQLVAGVAHELNNPIGYTHSNINHLKDHMKNLKDIIKTTPKEKPNLDYILKDIDSIIESSLEGTQRTKDIVLSLRNFSRLDEAEIKEVDLHEGLESTLQLLSSELRNRITIHKEHGTLPKLSCHPSQINQVFMNILSNAAQAIDGNGEIWIKTECQSKQILISIQDSGKGIKPEHVDRIFDPFFTTKQVGKGTGLGLSISYGIIQKHNGEIKVTSLPGKGTTFTIILPTSGLSKKS